MSDHVIDTNVLVTGSASRVQASHVPAAERLRVFEWLAAFRVDTDRLAVLDGEFRIWREYRDNLDAQDFGLLVMTEKLQTARFHNVEYDDDGHARLPASLEAHVSDRNDRKFVAVALADGGSCTIVNATDADWLDAEPALAAVGIRVEQLLDEWLRSSAKR